MLRHQTDRLAMLREQVKSVRQSKRSPGDENRMVDLTSRILKAGLQVLLFHVWQFLEDFRPGQSGRKEIEHIRDANAHAPDAGTTPALFRVHGNPRRQIRHDPSVARREHSISRFRSPLSNVA